MRTRWNYINYDKTRMTIFEYESDNKTLYAETWRRKGRGAFFRESRWPTTPETARSYADNSKTFLEVSDAVADQIRSENKNE